MTPTAKAALDLIASEPGISVADLGDRLGVSTGRTWQIINILQYGRVRLTRDFAAERAAAPLAGNDLMHALVGHARQPRDLPHRQPSLMRRPDRVVALLAQPLTIRVSLPRSARSTS